MGIADREAALEKLHEFLRLQEFKERGWPYDVSPAINAAIGRSERLIEDIARELDGGCVGDVSGNPYTAIAATNRLIGILENQEVSEQILGPPGPNLAANRLHPWIWHAVVNLWHGGNYKQAVNAAAAAVEEQTQLKLDRGDLSGTDLYTQAFKVDKVGTKPDGRRLRFPHIDELTSDGKRNKNWTSAHQGAMNFGQGCAQGIRNLNAHGTGDLPEQEALECLAALSVLARWVDACEAMTGDPAQPEEP